MIPDCKLHKIKSEKTVIGRVSASGGKPRRDNCLFAEIRETPEEQKKAGRQAKHNGGIIINLKSLADKAPDHVFQLQLLI